MMAASRDNFLDIVDAWCCYVDACRSVGKEATAFDAFRKMDWEWDEPTPAVVPGYLGLRVVEITDQSKAVPSAPLTAYVIHSPFPNWTAMHQGDRVTQPTKEGAINLLLYGEKDKS